MVLRFPLSLGCLAAVSLVTFIGNRPVALGAVTRHSIQDGQPELYRFRLANTLHGGVEISTDSGKSWKLVARVSKPATKALPGKGGTAPMVLRSGKLGMALAAGEGMEVRVVAESPQSKADPSAIILNVPTTFTVFKDFLPAAGSPVQQVVTHQAVALAMPYTPRDGDVLLMTVRQSEIPVDKIAAYAEDASERYRDIAIARARSKGDKIISGFLTVNAKLSVEDVPAAVTFAVDGQVSAIMNRPPYQMRYDTRGWVKGEHLVEVRALDKAGGVMRLSKQIVIVDNTLPQ